MRDPLHFRKVHAFLHHLVERRHLTQPAHHGGQLVDDVALNGAPLPAIASDGALAEGVVERRLPANLNLSFGGVEGEALLVSMKDVAVSSGSACTSASLEPSHVLRAIGVPDDLAHASIRFGLGRWTTEEEIDYAAAVAVKAVERLRAGSPLTRTAQS